MKANNSGCDGFLARTAALLALAGSAWAGEPNSQRVNHFVGAAGESVPIQAPAFHGIEPRLALSYSSEARNGLSGMGWSLTGVSVIERANKSLGVARLSPTTPTPSMVRPSGPAR